MVKEAVADASNGLLGVQTAGLVLIQYETIYGAMPRMGLAMASEHLPAAEAARERLGQMTT